MISYFFCLTNIFQHFWCTGLLQLIQSAFLFISSSFWKIFLLGLEFLIGRFFFSYHFEYVHGWKPNCCWWWGNWWGTGLSAIMLKSPHNVGGLKVNCLAAPPPQIFPWFFLSWCMCLMSFKKSPKLSVTFFFFSFLAVLGLCSCSAWAPQCGGFSWCWAWALGCWLQ